MAFNRLSTDISEIIINYLLIKEAYYITRTNKENQYLIKNYYKSNMKQIPCSLEQWYRLFRNAKYANISRQINIKDSDLIFLCNVEKLDMHLCSQNTITNEAFRHLLKLKDLDLQGCCGPWQNEHHFTNKIFDYIGNIEKLYIDDNHIITDDGVIKLSKIKDLTIKNCSEITDKSISKLLTLRNLHIYNLHKLTNKAFLNLNIINLDITFIDITDEGILHLKNLRYLNFISCSNIKCINFDKLTKLKILSISGRQITDECLKYLKYIEKLTIYGCNINGSCINELTNVKILSIYETPINDMYIDNLCTLINIKSINIYRCPTISKSGKDKLKTIFGDKLKID